MDAADITEMLAESEHFIVDPLRGMERMYQIVQNRLVNPPWRETEHAP